MTAEVVKTIKCRVGNISLRSDGILYMEFEDDLTVELEDRIKIVEIIDELADGEKRLVLIKAGDRIKITEEARKYDMHGAVEKNVIKEALVIHSLSTRISAHFYYKICKPEFEIKIFKKMDEAEKWLKNESNSQNKTGS